MASPCVSSTEISIRNRIRIDQTMGGCSFFFSFEGEEDKGLGFGFLEGGFEEGSSVIWGDDSFANCLDIGNGNGIRIIIILV